MTHPPFQDLVEALVTSTQNFITASKVSRNNPSVHFEKAPQEHGYPNQLDTQINLRRGFPIPVLSAHEQFVEIDAQQKVNTDFQNLTKALWDIPLLQGLEINISYIKEDDYPANLRLSIGNTYLNNAKGNGHNFQSVGKWLDTVSDLLQKLETHTKGPFTYWTVEKQKSYFKGRTAAEALMVRHILLNINSKNKLKKSFVSTDYFETMINVPNIEKNQEELIILHSLLF
jgi:hypothetical protein